MDRLDRTDNWRRDVGPAARRRMPYLHERRLSFPPSPSTAVLLDVGEGCPMLTRLRTNDVVNDRPLCGGFANSVDDDTVVDLLQTDDSPPYTPQTIETTERPDESMAESSTNQQDKNRERALSWDGILVASEGGFYGKAEIIANLLGEDEEQDGQTASLSPESSLDGDGEEKKSPIWVNAMYGIINATIILPIIMSFSSIIYRNKFFTPYMPILTKLTVVSGMVHQLSFSTFSNLPMAIGQVQDAGLIFLSSMADSIVKQCQKEGHTDDAILATVTIGLGIATALLGLGLVIIGKLRLAQYIQKLPTCVVGGYLAYIGWFCGHAGLCLMAVSHTSSPIVEDLIHMLPGLLGGLSIYLMVKTIRHMAVLPTCIAALVCLFYIVLFATGSSVQEATDEGWIRKGAPPPVWYKTWEFLRFDLVVWSALPPQAFTLFSMIVVVALSSSLDIAAIDLELQNTASRILDYNREIIMVGFSNTLSGIAGGYTGSYIFSQTIFALRAGVRSRLAGYVLAACELLFLMLPIPILSYVPSFFFGSLLIMIAIDLMHEWLWKVRTKLTNVEYLLCLGTFGIIQLIGVEYGILAGVVVYAVLYRIGWIVPVPTQEEEDSSSLSHNDEDEDDLREDESDQLVPSLMDPNSSFSYGAV